MKVIVDTHALFWTLAGETKRLSPAALQAINDSESLIIPTIALLELLGLLEKKNKMSYFDKFIKNIPNSKYVVVPLDIAVLKKTRLLKDKLELHDRVIVATAKILRLSLITKDGQITDIYKKVIW